MSIDITPTVRGVSLSELPEGVLELISLFGIDTGKITAQQLLDFLSTHRELFIGDRFNIGDRLEIPDGKTLVDVTQVTINSNYYTILTDGSLESLGIFDFNGKFLEQISIPEFTSNFQSRTPPWRIISYNPQINLIFITSREWSHTTNSHDVYATFSLDTKNIQQYDSSMIDHGQFTTPHGPSYIKVIDNISGDSFYNVLGISYRQDSASSNYVQIQLGEFTGSGITWGGDNIPGNGISNQESSHFTRAENSDVSSNFESLITLGRDQDTGHRAINVYDLDLTGSSVVLTFNRQSFNVVSDAISIDFISDNTFVVFNSNGTLTKYDFQTLEPLADDSTLLLSHSEEIKRLYELNPDTNAFTDAEKARLANFSGNYKGEWSIDSDYSQGDITYYSITTTPETNFFFIAQQDIDHTTLHDVSNSNPHVDSANWRRFGINVRNLWNIHTDFYPGDLVIDDTRRQVALSSGIHRANASNPDPFSSPTPTGWIILPRIENLRYRGAWVSGSTYTRGDIVYQIPTGETFPHFFIETEQSNIGDSVSPIDTLKNASLRQDWLPLTYQNFRGNYDQINQTDYPFEPGQSVIHNNGLWFHGPGSAASDPPGEDQSWIELIQGQLEARVAFDSRTLTITSSHTNIQEIYDDVAKVTRHEFDDGDTNKVIVEFNAPRSGSGNSLYVFMPSEVADISNIQLSTFSNGSFGAWASEPYTSSTPTMPLLRFYHRGVVFNVFKFGNANIGIGAGKYRIRFDATFNSSQRTSEANSSDLIDGFNEPIQLTEIDDFSGETVGSSAGAHLFRVKIPPHVTNDFEVRFDISVLTNQAANHIVEFMYEDLAQNNVYRSFSPPVYAESENNDVITINNLIATQAEARDEVAGKFIQFAIRRESPTSFTTLATQVTALLYERNSSTLFPNGWISTNLRDPIWYSDTESSRFGELIYFEKPFDINRIQSLLIDARWIFGNNSTNKSYEIPAPILQERLRSASISYTGIYENDQPIGNGEAPYTLWMKSSNGIIYWQWENITGSANHERRFGLQFIHDASNPNIGVGYSQIQTFNFFSQYARRYFNFHYR